jgi:mRNA interferase HigB
VRGEAPKRGGRGQSRGSRHGLVPNLGTTYTGDGDMRVIARSTLSRFIGTLAGLKDRAAVKAALEAWYYEVKSAAWSSPAEVKRAYANASIIGSERVVFNIKGNSYRLVAAVDYQRQAVFIKWLGSHADYDRIDVGTVQHGDQAY